MPEQRTPVVEAEDRKGVRWVHIREHKLGWTIDPRALKSGLMAAVAGAERAAVDFSEVTYLCSSTIGTVITFNHDARAAGCKVVFFRMQPYVRDTFRALGLDNVLAICDTDEEAEACLGT